MSCSRVVRPDPLERAEHHAAELPQPHGPEAQRPQARELRARDRGERVGPEDTAAVPVPSAPAVASAENMARGGQIRDREDCCSY